jgi:hypothetical protein
VEFGLEVFHRTETSLQAHLTTGESESAQVFALFHLHVPPMANAYASVHIVEPELIDEDLVPEILQGLGEVAAEELDLLLTSAIVTAFRGPDADGSAWPDVKLEIERHRPSSSSSRDLLVDRPSEPGAKPRLVATLERFRDDDGSMSVLTILDDRFQHEDAVAPLMRIFDDSIGTPVGAGEHGLDVLFSDFLGEFGAQPAAEAANLGESVSAGD